MSLSFLYITCQYFTVINQYKIFSSGMGPSPPETAPVETESPGSRLKPNTARGLP